MILKAFLQNITHGISAFSPNGDFFEAIRKKEASVVTGHIERFVEDGVLMKDGKQSSLWTSFSTKASNTRKLYIFRHSRRE